MRVSQVLSCGHDLPILLDFSVHSLLSNRFYSNIGFLIICPPREFFVLFVIKVMALVAGRESDTVVS